VGAQTPSGTVKDVKWAIVDLDWYALIDLIDTRAVTDLTVLMF